MSAAEREHAARTYDAIRRLLVAYADRYEELCARRSGVDFDHLQLLALELLRERPAIAEAQRERFDHLLVDEFQDTSPIQVELVRALCGPATRLFAVVQASPESELGGSVARLAGAVEAAEAGRPLEHGEAV